MHFWRHILLTLFICVTAFGVVAEISNGIDCEQKDSKCGLKAYYKDGDAGIFKKLNFKGTSPVYASKFSPLNVDENGGFYIDENINFNFSPKQNDRYFYPYKSLADPLNAPLQISQKSWSVEWKGYIYVQDTGTYAFFTDDNSVNFSVTLNDKKLQTISLKELFLTSNNLDISKNFIKLTQGYHDINIKLNTNSKDAVFSLLWLNYTNPEKTTGRAKFKNPQNIFEYMRVIGKDSFSWQVPHVSTNLSSDEVRVIDERFFIQDKSSEWKFYSPMVTKHAGKAYRYCLVAKNGANSHQIFDIYAKYTNTTIKNNKSNINYEFSKKLASIRANECFLQSFEASKAVVLGAFKNGESKTKVLEYLKDHYDDDDAFAVLPANFMLQTDDTSAFKAGKKASWHIIANDINGKISKTYSTKLTQKTINLNKREILTNTLTPKPNDDSCKTDVKEVSLVPSIIFNGGVSTQEDVIFDDVVSFEINILDDEFSQIDSQKYQNFSTQDDFKKAKTIEQVKKYGYECKDILIKGITAGLSSDGLVSCYVKNADDVTLDVLPTSFDINASISGAFDENFVYVNDNNKSSHSQMSASLILEFLAKSYNGKELKNFTKNCYAKDILVEILHEKDEKFYFLQENNGTFVIKKELFRDGKAKQALAFNFNKSDNKEPFLIDASKFEIKNLYTKDNKNLATNQQNSDKKVAFLNARVYSALHELNFNDIKVDEHYGFFCEKNCDLIENFDFFGELMPASSNWRTNKKHSENFDIAKNYESLFVGSDESKFKGAGKLENGIRELTFENNSQKEGLKDKISPIFDDNITWFEQKPYFWLRLYRQDDAWHGKSYNTNGEQKSVGEFIYKTIQERKNRRIEW
ncbi:hypothetical protein [Campylobacter suis]|uniref:PA14 domain-containing protein n=1 Tax=Campylobacter suis TaxID=2790657 RepID=A0ABN7K214_9BACT|nr:hypothetical protein [Campylobacter suis]CAD7286573.1 hypothetical protein LMG8286_00406 [Campylobacter suis]